MKVYYDAEHDIDREFPITEAELQKNYELSCDVLFGFAEDYPTFEDWLSECLSKNGTLIETEKGE